MPTIRLRTITAAAGVVLLLGVVFVLINLLVDVLYAAIDPRIRLSEAKG